mmetsp:Transcript_42685/g.106232  ORF Transcript_42685/g.106232 Transcript_42685/m.106232 type:complete len:149 (+) Transcript_42685:1623-2069(+)
MRRRQPILTHMHGVTLFPSLLTLRVTLYTPLSAGNGLFLLQMCSLLWNACHVAQDISPSFLSLGTYHMLHVLIAFSFINRMDICDQAYVLYHSQGIPQVSMRANPDRTSQRTRPTRHMHIERINWPRPLIASSSTHSELFHIQFDPHL